MSHAKLSIALSTLIAVLLGWAAPSIGAALPFPTDSRFNLRDGHGRGLLIDVWVDQSGPFAFAIDSGAGVSIASQRVIDSSHTQVRTSGRTLLGGLSTSPITSNHQATLRRFSLGQPNGDSTNNTLTVAVTSSLPNGVDGILDPADISPNGYAIDLPNRQLTLFDANHPKLRAADQPEGGAVVRWIRQSGDDRPYVRLADGRLALIDTGSNLGLAVRDPGGRNHERTSMTVKDLGGGKLEVHRVAPTTVSIGEMELRNIPTDVISGAPVGTPVILGRDALSPFRITFDPIARLIEIVPSGGR